MTAAWGCIGLTIFYVFRMHIFGQMMIETAFLAVLLGTFLPLSFLVFPATKKAPRNKVPWYDVILAVLSVAGPAFVFIFALRLSESLWQIRPPPLQMGLGILTWVLVIEGARRVVGWPFAVIAAIISVYPLFASHMPSVFLAKSYPLQRLVGFHFLSRQSIFGIPMYIFGNLLIAFMVFGIALEATGAAKFLINIAQGLMGRARGGPALVAVVASAFMASLSGSSIANVVATGSVTIPAMKRLGFEPRVAGAIEACASNGGQLMPPVMGAAAFIMAAFLEIPYAWVCLAAFLPMIVYYVGLLAQVYLYAHHKQIPAVDASEIPPLRKTLGQGWFYLGSIFVLIYLLFWIRVESWAPWWATLFLILCAFVRKETRPNLGTLSRFTVNVGHILAYLAPILAAVGLIIGALSVTGVASSIASELVVLARGNLYLLLVMGAIGAFVFGMGLSMTPCYIFMALVFAPSLIKLGVYPISAHLFFLYWGMLSFITPPVCTCVYAASAIAGSPVMRTGVEAVRLAIIIYIIPFVFVLNPAMVADGPILQILLSMVLAIIGALLIAVAMEGYMIRIGKVMAIVRVLLFFAGIFLLFAPILF
ncbi:TRAP transporter permease [Chloroflexota bacterium]